MVCEYYVSLTFNELAPENCHLRSSCTVMVTKGFCSYLHVVKHLTISNCFSICRMPGSKINVIQTIRQATLEMISRKSGCKCFERLNKFLLLNYVSEKNALFACTSIARFLDKRNFKRFSFYIWFHEYGSRRGILRHQMAKKPPDESRCKNRQSERVKDFQIFKDRFCCRCYFFDFCDKEKYGEAGSQRGLRACTSIW